jgi:hypothetical protein
MEIITNTGDVLSIFQTHEYQKGPSLGCMVGGKHNRVVVVSAVLTLTQPLTSYVWQTVRGTSKVSDFYKQPLTSKHQKIMQT